MNELKNRLLAKRKNNKGFTLVELIIVIAIIAVLAAVIAPQYIKYVENSREATDKNAASEIAHAAEVAAVGDGTTVIGDGSFKLVIGADGKCTAYSDSSPAALATKAAEVIPATSYDFKSTAFKGHTLTFTVASGVGTYEIS